MADFPIYNILDPRGQGSRFAAALVSVQRLAAAGLVAGLAIFPLPSYGIPSLPLEPAPLRPRIACPQDVEQLVSALLRDLPSYANRVANRSLGNPAETTFGTLLLAGAAEFEAIDLSQRPSSQLPGSTSGDLQQVFFTTLERRYQDQKAFNLQGFHWLFLTSEDSQWWLGPMYSSFSSYPDGDDSPTPPQASRHGIIGQAVQIWLRDCRAGAVMPLDDSGE